MRKSFLCILVVMIMCMVGCVRNQPTENQIETPSKKPTNEESVDEIRDYKDGLLKETFSKETYIDIYVGTENPRDIEEHFEVESDYIFLDKENIGYNPKFFIDEDGRVIIWFTSADGQLIRLKEGQSYSKRSLIGNAHCYERDFDISDIIIESNSDHLIKLTSNGTVSMYKFGEETNRWKLPKETEYCGESYWEGNIFLDNKGNVYALRSKPTQMVKIAKDVDKVLNCEYQFTMDYFSQPLFKMKDETIKVYLNIDGEEFENYEDHLYGIDEIPEPMSEKKLKDLEEETINEMEKNKKELKEL